MLRRPASGRFFEPPEFIPRGFQLGEQYLQYSGGRPTVSLTIVQYHNATLHAEPAREANQPARVRNAVIQGKDRSRHRSISPASGIGNLLFGAKAVRRTERSGFLKALQQHGLASGANRDGRVKSATLARPVLRLASCPGPRGRAIRPWCRRGPGRRKRGG